MMTLVFPALVRLADGMVNVPVPSCFDETKECGMLCTKCRNHISLNVHSILCKGRSLPAPRDKDSVKKVVEKFIELRGNQLNEGLVFRQFEKLEFLTQHSKSNLPLTKELRLFFFKQNLVGHFHYWDEGEYGKIDVELGKFLQVAKKIESNFFTMDIAQKTNDYINKC